MTARRRALTDRSHADRLHLGQQLRTRRERLGMTQDALAAITNLHQCAVSNVEGARRDVLLSTVLDLATALDRRLAVVAEHHLPLLDLTDGEVTALVQAADRYADEWATDAEHTGLPADQPDPQLLTGLAKLRPALDADTYPADYDLDLCQPADPT